MSILRLCTLRNSKFCDEHLEMFSLVSFIYLFIYMEHYKVLDDCNKVGEYACMHFDLTLKKGKKESQMAIKHNSGEQPYKARNSSSAYVQSTCSLAPLAAFGWVIATHLSLYPVILIVPLILLLCHGLDAPPSKLFQQKNSDASGSSPSSHSHAKSTQTGIQAHYFSWRPALHFLLWASIWSCYVLFLSSISLKGLGGLLEMFKKTHGFILTVQDLSPNIGVLWYFFAEVFDFFRNFFLIVFNMNILFMLLPLAMRLKHRPCFLAFVYLAISSMLKSYPSVGDAALYLGLLGLFANELAGMQFSFFLFCGYIGVSLLSPVMHNLWIWRGTGNANFYFATGIAYACLQTVLVVESVSTMLKYDRMLRKHITT
uniref:Phosphatidylinositol glycan anchor biosynthesis class U protein isoform X5 n=1 Tax=Elaeis guineensis var. tenera TaxID=51953 RepID=A0A8N4F3D6_ELAGV|nr:phosphatidylinositol glycan anchor biosynthesis class U protein isoform X5 [Elaeis guineensis]